MKKIIYFLLLLTSISCHEPSVTAPDRAALAKHQAPFGSETVTVKLREILSDSQIISEFIYKDDYLSEHKKYLKFYGYQAQYAATVFKRSDSAPLTGEKFLAEYIPEYLYLGEMTSNSTMTYPAPTTDSTREILEKYASEAVTTSRKYIFDKKGFVVREDFTQSNATAYKYQTSYTRNIQNNISIAKYTPVDPALATVTEYEYDNHPNPFFYLGLDWNSEMSVNSFNPNNVTKKTTRFSDGQSKVTTYEYEYLPNGYPGKIEIKEIGSMSTIPYILEFKY